MNEERSWKCLWEKKQFQFEYGIFCCLAIKLNLPISVHYSKLNRIGGVMESILPSSAVDRGFEPRLEQTNDYKNGMCCFSA
jgi:hypothetical protein